MDLDHCCPIHKLFPHKPFLPSPYFQEDDYMVWEGITVQDKRKVWSMVGEGWDGTECTLASCLCWHMLVAQVILNPEFPRNSAATLLFVPQLISISGSQDWILEIGNKNNSSIYWMFGDRKKRKNTQNHPIIWKVGRSLVVCLFQRYGASRPSWARLNVFYLQNASESICKCLALGKMVFVQVHFPLIQNRSGERWGAYSEEGRRDLNLICLLQLYLTHQHGLVLGYLLSKI